MASRKIVIDSLQAGFNAGLNIFGAQLLMESYGDKGQFEEDEILFVLLDHTHKPVYLTLSRSPPESFLECESVFKPKV